METLKNNIIELIENYKYNEAVDLIAESLSLEFKAEFIKNDFYFVGDKYKRDIYKITLKRGQRKYTFNFGQSLNNSGFYGKYGVQKYNIPYNKLKLSDSELRRYIKQNYNFDFNRGGNDKIIRPIAPSLYDVLTCLQKYEVGTFEDFCNDFGYDTDSRTAKKTYKAVVKEYDKMCSLFNNEELEILTEIQ